MSEKQVTGIVVADDHEVFRLGIRLIVESIPGLELVAEAGNGTEAIATVRRTMPDVLVLDHAMPDQSGLEVVYELQRYHSPVRILMVTAMRTETVIAECLAAGVHGICLKHEPESELRRALEAVVKGQSYVSNEARELGARASALATLTPRERQVVMQVIHGKRNREIADSLNISIKTVDVHRTNVMKKLDVHSAKELVEFANRAGLVD